MGRKNNVMRPYSLRPFCASGADFPVINYLEIIDVFRTVTQWLKSHHVLCHAVHGRHALDAYESVFSRVKRKPEIAGTVKTTVQPVAAFDLCHQSLLVRHGTRPFAFRLSLLALPVSGVGLGRGPKGPRLLLLKRIFML